MLRFKSTSLFRTPYDPVCLFDLCLSKSLLNSARHMRMCEICISECKVLRTDDTTHSGCWFSGNVWSDYIESHVRTSDFKALFINKQSNTITSWLFPHKLWLVFRVWNIWNICETLENKPQDVCIQRTSFCHTEKMYNIDFHVWLLIVV